MKTRNARRRQQRRYIRYLEALPIAGMCIDGMSDRLARHLARTFPMSCYDTWAHDTLKLAPEVRRRGVYCPHGKRLMRPDPFSREEYPPNVFVHPWACPEPTCTKAKLIAEFEAEEYEYQASRWADYQASQGF